MTRVSVAEPTTRLIGWSSMEEPRWVLFGSVLVTVIPEPAP